MKKGGYIVMLLCLILFLIALSPVDNSQKNSIPVTGRISKITEAGVKDVVFEMDGNKITYYINRGLESKFTLEDLNKDLKGKQVTLYYAKHWTPLAPFGTSSKHITRIELGRQVLYSEF